MSTALSKLDYNTIPTKLSAYDEAVLTGKLPERICQELDNEEWSKPYSDVDEMFKDLGLYD